jgi:hypothetical protein
VTAGGTAPFGYQWQFNEANIPGQTNSVLALSNIQSNQAGAYRVLVFNTAGSVLSSNALLTVLIPATITQAPTNQTQRVTINTNGFFYNPTNVTMSVGAIGTGLLRYQWRFNDVNLPGATNATLVLSNFQSSQVGSYNILVLNSGGYAIGTNFIVSGRTLLQITSQPLNIAVQVGQTANFTVGAVGAEPFFYQWLFNSTAIPLASNSTANSPSLVIPGATTNNNGAYRVVITNAFGAVTSAVAQLLILPPFGLKEGGHAAKAPMRIGSVRLTEGGVSIEVSEAEPVKGMVLEYKDRLSDTEWKPLRTNQSGQAIFVDPLSDRARYYRVREE